MAECQSTVRVTPKTRTAASLHSCVLFVGATHMQVARKLPDPGASNQHLSHVQERAVSIAFATSTPGLQYRACYHRIQKLSSRHEDNMALNSGANRKARDQPRRATPHQANGRDSLTKSPTTFFRTMT